MAVCNPLLTSFVKTSTLTPEKLPGIPDAPRFKCVGFR
jgi:hypothetical protein